MIRDAVPAKFNAGDTWRWTRDLSDYPATTWSVTYYFENEARQFSQAATADGTSHAVVIAAATSADIPAGRYRWFARAVSGSISETIEGEDGWLEVLPNPAATGTRDHRTWARKALDALEAALLGNATADQLAVTINGRSISRIPLAEKTAWRDKLRTEVAAQEAGTNASKGRFIKVRLGRG